MSNNEASPYTTLSVDGMLNTSDRGVKASRPGDTGPAIKLYDSPMQLGDARKDVFKEGDCKWVMPR
jgi:hypothetical protein